MRQTDRLGFDTYATYEVRQIAVDPRDGSVQAVIALAGLVRSTDGSRRPRLPGGVVRDLRRDGDGAAKPSERHHLGALQRVVGTVRLRRQHAGGLGPRPHASRSLGQRLV